MPAICRDGPAEGQHLEIPNPPPKAIRVEVFPDDDDDKATPVAEGTEFPTIVAEAYSYRLADEFVSQVGNEITSALHTVEYTYDQDLDPDTAEYIT